MRTPEFLIQSQLNAHALDAWVDAGWLRPHGSPPSPEFFEIDVARARLICALRDDFGINDEAVPVVLNLIDQIHGLRRLVRELMERSQP